MVCVRDLALLRAGRRWLIELVGFATTEYLAAKLARYRATGASDISLCVDERRAPDARVDPNVLAYAGKLTATDLLRFVEELP